MSTFPGFGTNIPSYILPRRRRWSATFASLLRDLGELNSNTSTYRTKVKLSFVAKKCEYIPTRALFSINAISGSVEFNGKQDRGVASRTAF